MSEHKRNGEAPLINLPPLHKFTALLGDDVFYRAVHLGHENAVGHLHAASIRGDADAIPVCWRRAGQHRGLSRADCPAGCARWTLTRMKIWRRSSLPIRSWRRRRARAAVVAAWSGCGSRANFRKAAPPTKHFEWRAEMAGFQQSTAGIRQGMGLCAAGGRVASDDGVRRYHLARRLGVAVET